MGDRRDLNIIDVNLMRRDWYLNFLERQFPKLAKHGSKKMLKYRTLRDEWEKNPGEFEKSSSNVNNLQNAYIDLVNELITNSYSLGGVYVSKGQEEGVGRGYDSIPVGLTYQLIKAKSGVPELPKLKWNLKYLLGWEHLLPDEPAKKVFQTHILMLQNRAIYLLNHGKIQQAEKAIYLAYQLSPSNEKNKKLASVVKTYAYSNEKKAIDDTRE